MNTNNRVRFVSKVYARRQALRMEWTPFNWVDVQGFNFKWQTGVYFSSFGNRGGVCVCQPVVFPVPVFHLASRLTLTYLQEWRSDSARSRWRLSQVDNSISVNAHRLRRRRLQPASKNDYYKIPPGGRSLLTPQAMTEQQFPGSLRLFRLSHYPGLRRRWRHGWAGNARLHHLMINESKKN